MLQHVKRASVRWEERLGAPRVPPTPSIFPDDAVAVIYKPARSATTSGTARTREWKLRFGPRAPRSAEPLMGWTASDDTLAQVELAFPSAEAALAYARRQGLHHVVHGLGDVGVNVRQIAEARRAGSVSLGAAMERARHDASDRQRVERSAGTRWQKR